MKKNGFTLVEMISVVVILVALGTMAILSITGTVKKSTDKLYETQVNSILDASRTYVVKNSSILSDYNEITLCDLKRSSLVDENIKNPKTEEPFDSSLIVKIEKDKYGEFSFVFDGVSKMENYYCDLDVTVTLNGNSPLYVSLGEAYVDYGITVKRKNVTCALRTGNQVTAENRCYYDLTKTGTISNALSGNRFNKVGTFIESYTVTDAAFSSTITRTITIGDKTPPLIAVSYGGSTYTNPFEVRILEGTTATFSCSAYDAYDGNLICATIKDEYQKTTLPGTYEIIYRAIDSSGNSSSIVVSVVVLAKNKNILAGIVISNEAWTNEDINVDIYALYTKNECARYNYNFNYEGWTQNDSYVISENGTYRFGIKCYGSSSEDYLVHTISNIDKVAPNFTSIPGSITVSSVTGNLKSRIKDGKIYYYTNGEVTIDNPSGGSDAGSGIEGYDIYVDGSLYNGETLTEPAKYEVSIQAYDYAGNRSESERIAYIIIEKNLPRCEFVSCNYQNCSELNPITGNVTVTGATFRLTDNNFPKTLTYKLFCTNEYYSGEDDSLEVTLDTSNFYMQGDNEELNNITINSIALDSAKTETTCNGTKCSKKSYYNITLNLQEFKAAANAIYLTLSEGAICDYAGNCSLGCLENASCNVPFKSMGLYPAN